MGCLGDDFNEALLKSILSVGYRIPEKNILVSSGDALQKADLLNACRLLASHGYTIYATAGTYRYLVENEVSSKRVLWPSECEDPLLSSHVRVCIEDASGQGDRPCGEHP